MSAKLQTNQEISINAHNYSSVFIHELSKIPAGNYIFSEVTQEVSGLRQENGEV